jgi:hypothetical protein
MVRVYYHGQVITRSYADATYGDTAAALQAARHAHCVIEQILGIIRNPDTGQRSLQRRPNPQCGVHYTYTWTSGHARKAGRPKQGYWVATWNENGRPKSKRFSVKQCGHAGAKAKAVAYRQAIIRTLYPDSAPTDRDNFSDIDSRIIRKRANGEVSGWHIRHIPDIFIRDDDYGGRTAAYQIARVFAALQTTGPSPSPAN